MWPVGFNTFFPQDPDLSRPLTLKELVDLTGHEGIRLPAALTEALATLRRERSTLTRALLRLSEEEGQRVAYLRVKVVPWHLSDPAETDAIYEALEGASTDRLTIRAELVEQNALYRRSLPVDTSELLETAHRLDPDEPDPEDAWLLVTSGELFDDHFDETDRLIEIWQAENGVPTLPDLLTMTVIDGRQKLEQHAVQMPEGTELGPARRLAEQLAKIYQVEVMVVQAQRVNVRPAHRASIYESAREMARRLRATSKQ